MVGWVVGGVILVLAALVIWRSVSNIVKGRSACKGCGNKDCPHCAAHGRDNS